MKTRTDASVVSEASDNKPHAMLGAGRLTASIWKSPDQHGGWQCRFNIFRMTRRNGRVTQQFAPRDLPDLARLVQLLAFTLSDDGLLGSDPHDDLSCLAACLDDVLPGGR